jgi:hypothetical protein
MNCFCISNDDVYPIQDDNQEKKQDVKQDANQEKKQDWPPPPPIPPTPKNTEHQILISPIIYNESYIKK